MTKYKVETIDIDVKSTLIKKSVILNTWYSNLWDLNNDIYVYIVHIEDIAYRKLCEQGYFTVAELKTLLGICPLALDDYKYGWDIKSNCIPGSHIDLHVIPISLPYNEPTLPDVKIRVDCIKLFD
jgi:hypothetical protein